MPDRPVAPPLTSRSPGMATARVAVGFFGTWIGFHLPPLVVPKWTHGQEFDGLSLHEAAAWMIGPWVATTAILALLFGVGNYLLLRRLTLARLLSWACLLGAYFSALVFFGLDERLEHFWENHSLPLFAFEVGVIVALPTAFAAVLRPKASGDRGDQPL